MEEVNSSDNAGFRPRRLGESVTSCSREVKRIVIADGPRAFEGMHEGGRDWVR
jgi:hypothetical protein